MDVTTETHPQVFEAFETISHDSGGGAGHPSYTVPHPWSDQLDEVQAALATLTPEDLLDFCIGEAREVRAIANRTPALEAANRFLNLFFEDWIA